MNKATLLVFVFLICLSCKKNEQKASIKKEPQTVNPISEIDSLLRSYEKNETFMGSIALSEKGKTIYSKTIGFSNIEANTKADENTKYRIGSISKTYTAALVLKAVEEGKIALDETIDKYAPSIKNASKITIAYLLQHRSGIHNFTKDKSFFEYRTEYKSPKEMLALIATYDSDFEPNTKGDYSNSNYFLLAYILEKVYNKTYNELLQEKICMPLGLKNTYDRKKIDSSNNEAHSYSFAEGKTKFPETNLSITLGSGSIVSTAKEVNQFITALLTGKLLSDKSIALMKTIKDNYGMGLYRYKITDRHGLGHRGHIDEFRATAIYFPKEQVTLTAITNGSSIDINDLFLAILKRYFKDAPIEISETELEKFAGTYVYEKDATDKAVFVRDHTTLVHIIKGEFKSPLVYKGNNRFVMEQMYAESISFIFSADGSELSFVQGDFKGKYTKE